MDFLRPQLLYGLFALAIPIIIHLFNFRKTKRVYFSSTRFLKQVKDATSSKLKLKHYLILLSRLLFLFFLIMAFAQPIVPGEGNTSIASKVAMYLDNSFSMSNEVDDGRSAFNSAINRANELIKVYPKGTTFKLLTNDFDPFSITYKSSTEVEDQLTKIQMTGISRSADEILNRLANENDTDSLDVFWMSDFQKSTFGESGQKVADQLKLNLIPELFTANANVFVDSLYIENPFLIGNEKLKLNVLISNRGDADVSGLGVKVFMDKRQVSTALVDIPALGKKEISFDVGYDLKKLNRGRVSIEEYPVTFDNDLYFVINQLDKIAVLEVRNENSSKYIKEVYANTNLFDFKSYDISNLNYNELDKSDFIIMNELDLTSALVSALMKKINNDGHVLLIPNSKPDLSNLGLLGANVSFSEAEVKYKIASPDFNDPFYENVFEEKNPRFQMPEAQPVLFLGNDKTAYLNFQNGSSYLRQIKKGLTILAAPLSNEYSTFANHALFVPVMYKLAALSERDPNRLYYYTDDNYINVQIDSIRVDNVLKLSNNDVELIPSQRILNNSVQLQLPSNELKSGFYNLTFKGDTITTLAFNVPQTESNLDQFEPEELTGLYQGNVQVISSTDETNFRNQLESKYQGQPLWKLAIVLALVFLLSEVLLIRFFP
ncbi:BatA domain-containing protein [Fulvivirga lutea]|uniref:BatA domain-containing protein n=1 Tax=Fulvivirga lutea TaxID=2810512 RepID=A0A974ZZA0_9BACT|nr:BatA domain-containing protein [Fulvivirga lutea]QSE95904.1 BatA domain-containing protein [Fulvivirga lutea]